MCDLLKPWLDDHLLAATFIFSGAVQIVMYPNRSPGKTSDPSGGGETEQK